MTTLNVNGRSVDVPPGASVLDLVKQVEPERWERGVAVAVNGEVVPKTVWQDTQLSESDRVEVLAAIGGG
ncbi:MAG: sulfur carrier protein ThiS [Actinomycetota bacterium]